MTGEVEGRLDGTGLHIGIVVSSWNRAVTDRLLDGALKRCEELAVAETTVLRVPGALEIPLGARALVDAGCDGVAALGTVVKGDTDHYDIVVRESSAGIARVALDTGVPVANGVLAVHAMSDAVDRAQPGGGNKGREAIDAAVAMADALRSL